MEVDLIDGSISFFYINQSAWMSALLLDHFIYYLYRCIRKSGKPISRLRTVRESDKINL